MALRLLSAASGENAVVFSDEEFQALVEERGNTIKALKLELVSRDLGSRFRLRLLQAEEHLELGDDVAIVPPLVLKMVRLAFLPADEERDDEFIDACQEGRLEEVERRLHQPQDPNTANTDGYTGLHGAAAAGHVDVVGILLEAGASCDRATSYEGYHKGITPLHCAAAHDHLQVVRLLLQAAASSNTADAEGIPALYLAAKIGDLELVRLLLEAGASCNQACSHGGTALHEAAVNRHLEMVHLLLQAGATCDHAWVVDPVAGWTSLHWAARCGYLDVVQLLVEFGATRDARTRDGETPVELAAKHGFQDVVDFLNVVELAAKHAPAKRLKREHVSES
ncbi:unnamed protein product [Durusdinium trenchii]|uniref:Uncharacterized protein n=1 Tax=Durusdinium trenchii TaxID=1381693 RepID=A0ABP0NNY7_9DINO